MIDAYEIGIQLLLQEDVSAGLAVINRGLEEVDRAIAATSANLAGLVQDAERAAKAVAVAVGARPPQVGGNASKSIVPTPEAAPRRATPESAPVEGRAAPVIAGVENAKPSVAAARQVAPVEDLKASSTPQATVAAVSVSPVTASSRAESAEPKGHDRPNSTSADISGAAPVARQERLPAVSDAISRQGRRDTSLVDPGRRNGAVSPNTTIAVTAAVGPSRALLPPTVQRERAGTQASIPPSSGGGRMAAAPWSAVDQAAPQSLSARSGERATAPQSPGRERAEGGGGGTVMLDGRLVGQWLSEHMAREASRPPGGTSFFDARQTPAWNVSGAL